jgi:hypothetical protein
MTRLSAFTALQDRFGKEEAKALAEFVESQDGPSLSHLSTKDDMQALRQDFKDLELRIIKEISLSREEAATRDAKTREDMISRIYWATIIQVVALLGGIVALAKII